MHSIKLGLHAIVCEYFLYYSIMNQVKITILKAMNFHPCIFAKNAKKLLGQKPHQSFCPCTHSALLPDPHISSCSG